MNKRKALAAAAAITMVALAATIALGANLGLFGLTTARSGPGDFAPVGVDASAAAGHTESAGGPAPTGATEPDRGQGVTHDGESDGSHEDDARETSQEGHESREGHESHDEGDEDD